MREHSSTYIWYVLCEYEFMTMYMKNHIPPPPPLRWFSDRIQDMHDDSMMSLQKLQMLCGAMLMHVVI